jgi:hypothetical protein
LPKRTKADGHVTVAHSVTEQRIKTKSAVAIPGGIVKERSATDSSIFVTCGISLHGTITYSCIVDARRAKEQRKRSNGRVSGSIVGQKRSSAGGCIFIGVVDQKCRSAVTGVKITGGETQERIQPNRLLHMEREPMFSKKDKTATREVVRGDNCI